jgi:pilus assembly protein Flp/PilA
MLAVICNIQAFVANRKALVEERGATAVEYALMVGLIAAGIIATVAALSNRVARTFNKVTGTLPS